MSLSRIGRYTVKSQLGRGALADVYRGRDPQLERDVAVKLLAPQFGGDPTVKSRILSEIRAIAALRHPNIVPVYDFGEEAQRVYLVMAYMPGGSLKERLLRGPLPVDEAVELLTKLGAALEYAHGLGVVHRDVRPANVLFDAAGEAGLSDFGLARLAQSRQTQTAAGVIGSPAYMSPEQVLGEADVDRRSDLYSLGAVMFELLTGRLPYQAATPMAIIVKQVSDPVPRLSDAKPDLPGTLQPVLDRAMAKRRDERFATAREFVEALQAAARGAAQAPAEIREVGERYLDFDLSISRLPGRRYRAQVLRSPAGEAEAEFAAPLSEAERELLLSQLGAGDHRALAVARSFGQRLFEAVFTGAVGASLEASLTQFSHARTAELRLKLRLDETPELVGLPWELLYRPDQGQFLALFSGTALVRYVDLPIPLTPPTVEPPLRLLALVAIPRDGAPLDVAKEKDSLLRSLARAQERGRLEVEFLEPPTLDALRWRLSERTPVHMLHYLGQSTWDDRSQESGLVLESEDGRAETVSARILGEHLIDARSLGVVTLAAGRGAQATPQAGLVHAAATLARLGLPAVLTSQFDVPDRSAARLNEFFYAALADGRPVDLALSEARKALYGIGADASWGAPLLFQRAPDGRVFNLVTPEARVNVRASRVAIEVERSLSVQRANERLAETLVELGRFSTLAEIAGTERRLDWLPEGLTRDLDLDVVETLPGVLAIAKDIAAAQQLDVYGRRLTWHRALEGLDALLKRLPTLGERAARWQPVLSAWQAIVLRAIADLVPGSDEGRVANPYLAGNPLQLAQKALFKGRRDLRDAVVNALLEKTRPTLVLQGPRRMGKTSFLLQLPALLPGKTIPVFVDLQKASATVSDSSFLYEMARAISAAAQRYQVPIATPNRDRLAESPYETFDTWADQVVVPGLGDFQLLLTLDEFEKVGEALRTRRLSRQVLDELRHTIQHRAQIALLFAGVQSLDELGPDWSSYFINVRVLNMSYLSPAETEDLIRRPDPATPFNLEYTTKAVKRITRDTLGHPYLVQLVCSAIVEQANTRRARAADEDLVEAGEVLALERGEPYFRNLWDEAAGPDGQPLLRRIAAAAEPVSIGRGDAARQRSLQRLLRHGVITRRQPQRATRASSDAYVVPVPLIRRWIDERAPMPPNRI